MNVLTNLVKRNLILNKRRTIVTIISIILSCALIGGVATLVGSFQKFMQDVAIESEGNYHAILNDVPLGKEKYIKNNSYIKDVMLSSDLGYALLNNGANKSKPYLFITAFDDKKLNNMPIKLTSGRLPKNTDEILISNHIAETALVKFNVGDTITLNIGNRMLDGEILDQTNDYNFSEDGETSAETFEAKQTHTYKIVGAMERPIFENYNAPGYTVITYLDSKALNEVSNLNVGVLVKDPKNIFRNLEEIAANSGVPKKNNAYDIDYHSELLRWYGVTDNDNANSMLYGFASILIAVIMIASVIVIYNSFNISITERKKQFGMLSSIGSTSRQIRNMVLKEGLLLSIIGIPLGIISSIVGIGITLMVVNSLGIFQEFYSARLTLAVSPLSIFITIFFGALTIFISSFIPALKASKTSPIDAIRLTSDIKIKGKKLKTSKLTRKMFGIEGELALKNMKRNRRKYRSTIISLFVSIILFMTINSFAEYSFRSSLKVYNDYNFNVGVNAEESILNKISTFDYIDKYSINKNIYMNFYVKENQLNSKILPSMKANYYDSEKGKYYIFVRLSTLGDTEFKRYAKEIGVNYNDYNDINNPKMIIIDKSNYVDMNSGIFYQLPLTNVKENDKIKLDSQTEEVITEYLNVGKITDVYPTGFNNADSTSTTIQAFISDELYNSLDNRLKDDGNTYLFIDSSNPGKLIKMIDNYEKESSLTINAENIDEMVELLKNVVLAISIFLYGFITLVSLITITNVINTITTSIYLRRREFAMLKAIGMTNNSFNKMIRFESIFYGIKSLVYGLPLGILIDYFMYKNVSSLFVYDYVLPYKAILISVIFVFVIISITMIYSVRKIRNDNIIDVIKQENL